MINSPLTGPGAIVSLVILCILFTFRVVRFSINQVGRIVYSPAIPRPESRTTHKDCSVILPIVNPNDSKLEDTVFSILTNLPAHLYIVTVGVESRDQVERRLGYLRPLYDTTQINIGAVNKANKRRQIYHAISTINTSVTIIADQGVYWPKSFLGSALPPFEDSEVAAVTVPQMARKPYPKRLKGSFWACLVSCYHALLADENRAVNALDSSALLRSSTLLFRTYHCATEAFRTEFESEKCFSGRSGVLKADEHGFLNRYFLQSGQKIAFQDTPQATIEVSSGTIVGFVADYIRTTRSTWRLSISMLRHKTAGLFLWACYAMWLSSLVSFTLFTDAIIILLMYYSEIFEETLIFWTAVGVFLFILQALVTFQLVRRVRCSGGSFSYVTILVCTILCLPAQYALELLKIVALLTFWRFETEERTQTDLEHSAENHEPSWIWGFEEMRDYSTWDQPPAYEPFSVE
ncbi:hypothetical protein F66182_6815 [Fusarium sp. NRRL 66182]|nr:hypothetical protein F66182_6815 [Fusarium sp. NRRL 66182]